MLHSHTLFTRSTNSRNSVWWHWLLVMRVHCIVCITNPLCWASQGQVDSPHRETNYGVNFVSVKQQFLEKLYIIPLMGGSGPIYQQHIFLIRVIKLLIRAAQIIVVWVSMSWQHQPLLAFRPYRFSRAWCIHIYYETAEMLQVVK